MPETVVEPVSSDAAVKVAKYTKRHYSSDASPSHHPRTKTVSSLHSSANQAFWLAPPALHRTLQMQMFGVTLRMHRPGCACALLRSKTSGRLQCPPTATTSPHLPWLPPHACTGVLLPYILHQAGGAAVITQILSNQQQIAELMDQAGLPARLR